MTEPGEPATEPSQPDTNEPSDSAVAPAYGVPMVDNDGDGVDADQDCIDEDPYTYPYAARYEENPELCRTDKDQDGWGSMTPAPGVEPGTDCNDGDASVNPGAQETAGDGVDSNCDGAD